MTHGWISQGLCNTQGTTFCSYKVKINCVGQKKKEVIKYIWACSSIHLDLAAIIALFWGLEKQSNSGQNCISPCQLQLKSVKA